MHAFGPLIVLALAASQDPHVLPPNPGLDGGKGGHWGLQSEEDWRDGRMNRMDTGPFLNSLLAAPGGVILKGLSIRLEDAGVCYDTSSLRLRVGWRGEFIAHDPTRYGLIGTPKIAGRIQFSAPPGPGWIGSKTVFRGHRLSGSRVILEYTVDGVPVLESPSLEESMFTRTFEIGPASKPLRAHLFERKQGSKESVTLIGDATLRTQGSTSFLEIPARSETIRVKVLLGSAPKTDVENLSALAQPGPPRWGKPIAAVGRLGRLGRPVDGFSIDTIPVPFKNKWNALMFLTGVDFFTNGDAAVSTVHGDVWVVRGLSPTLDSVTWKRFATGLLQPLGLRIVDDAVYILGRDRITRLRDENGDDEADRYESFFGGIATGTGHKYVSCLETDAAGNFYYVDLKGLHRVAPDGRSSTTLAGGWRHPNGMSVRADGTATVAPQEGDWTPASMICEVKPGGWYGFGGPRKTAARPLGVDPPLCYLPRLIDNSSGGQVWVTNDRWGPLKGQLLNLSFGRSSLQLILREKIDGQPQGAVVPTPLLFSSGVVRGRFHPGDGHLYVAGMKGWVSNAVRDGCLQRVRYEGGKILWPVGLRSHANGLRLTFAIPLDRERAENPDLWALEQWNYKYSKEYGSKEYSALRPKSVGHDPVEVKSLRLLEDGKSVFLEIPGLRPVNQLRVRYNLRGTERERLRGEVTATIHRLGPEGP